MPTYREIERFDFPSDHREEEENFFQWAGREYPYVPWLITLVSLLTVLHFVLFG